MDGMVQVLKEAAKTNGGQKEEKEKRKKWRCDVMMMMMTMMNGEEEDHNAAYDQFASSNRDIDICTRKWFTKKDEEEQMNEYERMNEKTDENERMNEPIEKRMEYELPRGLMVGVM
ncbi:unnamed protein product [Nippostrongylus brasiliensis]|uniref:Uncharacterized protein n=1 Tax=Nippostrongylus brasiliensis TaxID=27835 RepID=A0A0N4YCR1_NIPBR|nr:unnamed protein product [Nippostrongylus brasiliensis]